MKNENMRSNLSFEEEKLRDSGLRKRFYSKLDKIENVLRENSYIVYIENKHLYDELIEIYTDNLEKYNEFYIKNVNRFKLLQEDIRRKKDQIPDDCWNKLQHLLEEIQFDLNVHDYERNKSTEFQMVKVKIKFNESLIDYYKLQTIDIAKKTYDNEPNLFYKEAYPLLHASITKKKQAVLNHEYFNINSFYDSFKDSVWDKHKEISEMYHNDHKHLDVFFPSSIKNYLENSVNNRILLDYKEMTNRDVDWGPFLIGSAYVLGISSLIGMVVFSIMESFKLAISYWFIFLLIVVPIYVVIFTMDSKRRSKNLDMIGSNRKKIEHIIEKTDRKFSVIKESVKKLEAEIHQLQ
jgi:hypothetical protein